mmetsp:Transcript_29020/g.72357  ORF Transcript_29020/g.72357 Transcript_29020/m.72357 type:complete len:206 (-) Transcript_29020:535-1152(-)
MSGRQAARITDIVRTLSLNHSQSHANLSNGLPAWLACRHGQSMPCCLPPPRVCRACVCLQWMDCRQLPKEGEREAVCSSLSQRSEGSLKSLSPGKETVNIWLSIDPFSAGGEYLTPRPFTLRSTIHGGFLHRSLTVIFGLAVMQKCPSPSASVCRSSFAQTDLASSSLLQVPLPMAFVGHLSLSVSTYALLTTHTFPLPQALIYP